MSQELAFMVSDSSSNTEEISDSNTEARNQRMPLACSYCMRVDALSAIFLFMSLTKQKYWKECI